VRERDPALARELERLGEPGTRGGPASPLRWTCQSVRRLATELNQQGPSASHQTVAALRGGLGYSLPAQRKTREGSSPPDRNAPFEHLNQKVQQYGASRQPVMSVDTQKKELGGDFKNGGRAVRPKGKPEPVRVHDLEIPALGKVAPYGVYDLEQNSGWVNVGVDHATATWAVESIRRWGYTLGQPVYPRAKRLLITADSGGSNGARLRLWKWERQKLTAETGLHLSVSHFPPGTSQWNKMEQRLFSCISQNGRGKPLLSHEVIIQLIAATTTQAGLRVKSQLDTNQYPAGIKVSAKQMAPIRLARDEFHGEWNYSILPRRNPS